jgi:hypothetical protein
MSLSENENQTCQSKIPAPKKNQFSGKKVKFIELILKD